MLEQTSKDIYEVGEAPPLGLLPEKMHAYVIRADRFGEPTKSMVVEQVPVPDVADDEVLIYVMAAGVNYNNVWASLGIPVNVIAARNKQGEPEDFHIGGSDASGIVYKVGKDVRDFKVGDEVVVHCGQWDRNCPVVKAGIDPAFSPTFRTWGYEGNWGSFAQFAKVQAHQCVPKPRHLTWEAAASYMLVGATAYRMLHGWPEHRLRKNDAVLIWGGAGGLGSMAIQIARAAGAVPVAVVSGEDKFEYCQALGARGCIDRRKFSHWGMLPHWKDNVGYKEWLKGVRAFGAALWEALGEKRSPRIVFEHPGESTIPTSVFVCDTGGMVVICAGTTGFNATVDLRYLWIRQKRLQGSHFANDEQALGVNDLVLAGLVDPCLSKAFTFDEVPHAHQLMYENRHPHGNMAVLIGARDFGQGISAEPPRPAEGVRLPISETSLGDPERKAPVAVPPLGMDSQIEDAETATFPEETVRVRELMTVGVISCAPGDELEVAAKLLIDHDIHAVIVTDDDLAVGVVSQTDMALARQGRTPAETRKMPVCDAMTASCLTCDADAKLSDAISRMTTNRVHRLVVTEKREGRDVPVGVLSMTDIIRKTVLAGA